MSGLKVKQSVKILNKLQNEGVTTAKQLFSINSSYNDAKVVSLINNLLTGTTRSKNSRSQGDLMEDLARYLIDNCGFLESTKHGQKNRQQELDHSAEFNLPVIDYLKTKGVSKSGFLGESKNYPASKLDVNIVYKVEALKLFISAGVGIYFCRQGLTGSELAAGHALVKDFHTRYENCSLVFTDQDWVYLKSNPQKFGDLFYEKLVQFISMKDWKIDYKKV